MRCLSQTLAIAIGLLFGFTLMRQLTEFYSNGFQGTYVATDIALVVTCIFMIWLSLTLVRTLFSHEPLTAQGIHIFSATVAALAFGLFGALFITNPFAQAFESIDEWKVALASFGSRLVLLWSFVAAVGVLHVCRRIIRYADAPPAGAPSLSHWRVSLRLFLTLFFLPPLLMAVPMGLVVSVRQPMNPNSPPSVLLPDHHLMYLTNGIMFVVQGIVFLILAFRSLSLLRGNSNRYSSPDAGNSESPALAS